MKWKNRVIHAGVLVLVFLAAVVIFGYVTNKKNSNMTTDMGAATRPQIAFSYNGYSLNDLPGYKNEMDLTGVRDSITPVSNGQLQVTIKAYENVIDSLDYTVYSIDGKEKLLEQKVKKPGENATLEVGNVDGENILSEERMLQITLHMDNHDMYYYTRIVDGAKLNAAPSLDYVQSFHENALAKAEGVGIGTAIEPSDEGDNTTLQHVTIHSDYTHVTWGDLAPKVDGSERWTIKELNSTYMAVELEYRVNCTGEENEQDEYQVREYFRVRYISGSQKTYLLDYDRTMDQIFDATKKVLNEKGVLLGITDKNPVYMVNKNGTVVSFVQAGELWNYNRDRDEVSLVFSFADAENTDITLAGTFTILNGDNMPSAGTAEVRWTFTPTDKKYKPVNGTTNITVEKATPESAAAPTASELTYGQTLAESTLTGGNAVNPNTQEEVAGTWSWADDTVKPTVDNQGYQVVFTPNDTANYNRIEATVGVTVKKAVPTISEAPTASDLTYGQTLSESTLTGGAASTDGTFTWAKADTRPEVKDSNVTEYEVVFTPTDTVNWENAAAQAKVKVSPKILTWDGSALTVLTKLADEMKDASLIGELKVSGLLDGDDAGLSYENLTAEFDTAEAGSR